MDQTEIRDRFVTAIFATAEGAGRRLGDGNQHILPEMADRAAEAVVEKAVEGPDREILVDEGEAAFRDLVEEMVRAADAIPGYPLGVIGEQTLAAALSIKGHFPPFW